MYYLLDLERTIGIGRTFYWKPNLHGYTTILDDAGLFTESQAKKIIDLDFDKRTVMIHEDVVKRILKG